MIHELDRGAFVISSHHCWLPGSYATREAAAYAFQFSDAELQALADRICHVTGEHREITTDDLRKAREQRQEAPAANGGSPAD